MCLNTWSFKPVNVDKISCTNCVLRWTWEGHHISPTNPEKFENCIDVTIKNSPDTSSNSAVSESAKPGKILPDSAATAPTQKESETTPATPEPPTNDDISEVPSSGSESSEPVIQYNENSAEPSSVSESKGNDCACNLSVDSAIYSQCTADGNYCTCFSGPWSALGKVKMNCAPGTTCRQSESQIHCQ